MISPSWIMQQRHQAAERREAVVHGVDRAVGGGRGRHRPQAGIGDAEANLLAFHVGGIDAERGEIGVAGGFRPIGHGEEGDEDDRHHRIERPALARVLDHAAEGVGERGRDQQDEQHLDEIAERRRVLVTEPTNWRSRSRRHWCRAA